MKDRNKILKTIVVNVLELIVDNKMSVILEDYEDMKIIELDIDIKVRDIK